MLIKIAHGLLIFTFLSFYYGCAAGTIKDVNLIYPPAVVAVLPLVNDTADIEAPEYIRTIFVKKLSKEGYRIVEKWRIDELLKTSYGVTLGHQIKFLDLQKLGKELGADGLFYGTLKEFSFQHVVVAGLRRVEVHMELINVQNGQTVWSADAKASNSGVTLAPVDKAFGSTPLANEAKEVVLKLINKLLR